MFEHARKIDITGRSVSPKPAARLIWLAGTILTAGRRRSFICNRGWRFCFYCTLIKMRTYYPKGYLDSNPVFMTNRRFSNDRTKPIFNRAFLLNKTDIPLNVIKRMLLGSRPADRAVITEYFAALGVKG